MRELYVLSVSPDGRHVVLGATKGAEKGTHRVRLDARLVAAVRGDLRSVDQPEVDLSPKQIQARLRAGESVESIARSAGVPVTRVERFAGPVAGEMARMIDEAREAHLDRGRRGRSSVALGKTVDEALPSADSATWAARRADDGRWRVSVSWHARGRDREAAWWYDPAAKTLNALDPASATLGFVEAPAARRAPRPQPSKPAAKRPAPRKTPAPKAAPKAGSAAPAPAAKPRAKAAKPRLQVVPDPPAPAKRAPRKTAPPTAADQRDGVRGRATVPAWADVLLGTAPGTDR